jgi:hypothetical protein
MLKYKLTNQNNMTHNNTLWGENVTHETDGSGELCGPGWLHFYHSAELAVMMNPIHADIENPKLWECEAEGQLKDDRGLKGGCTRLTTIREIPLPKITPEQRIRVGILCARKAFGGKSEAWDRWAEGWLSGSDRSLASARVAGRAARAAARAADAADDADAAAAAYTAWAAYDDAWDAWAAARAARAAVRAAAEFDLQAIVLEALQGN